MLTEWQFVNPGRWVAFAGDQHGPRSGRLPAAVPALQIFKSVVPVILEARAAIVVSGRSSGA